MRATVSRPLPPCRLLANTRANVSIPDLHALEHRIRAIKTEMPGLAKDAAEVEGERKVSTPWRCKDNTAGYSKV